MSAPRRAPAAKTAARRPKRREATVEVGGTPIPLDGDLVFLIDALYREFAVKRGFAPAYADLQRAIATLLEGMPAPAAREYFAQSLFLNYVTYENEMAERLAAEITIKARRARGSR